MANDLAQRFGWWWRDPGNALLHAFPEKSGPDAVNKYVWPVFTRAAFNYELASRSGGRKKPAYLLGKRFDKFTPAQMREVLKVWPRKRPLQPFRFAHEAEPLTATQRALLELDSENSVILSLSHRRDTNGLTERATRRGKLRLELEQNYASDTGWTVPQLLTFNLAECGDTTIAKALKAFIKGERERLGIPDPKRNKGRANRSATGLSFHAIEAVDIRTHLPPGPGEAAARAEGRTYDKAQKRAAVRRAHLLHREWRKAGESAERERVRIAKFLSRDKPVAARNKAQRTATP